MNNETQNNNNNNKPKNKKNKRNQMWKKRMEIIQIIYSFMVSLNPNNKNFAQEFLYDCYSKYKLDKWQTQILSFAITNFDEIKNQYIVPNLKPSWFFEQINFVNVSIITESIAENKEMNTPKGILIDQAIITTKNFCDDLDYKFINAILDKVLI